MEGFEWESWQVGYWRMGMAAPVKERRIFPREEYDPTLHCMFDISHSMMMKANLGVKRLPRWVGCWRIFFPNGLSNWLGGRRSQYL